MPEELPKLVPADIEAIDRYWEEEPESFSARILSQLLASGPAADIFPFKPTPAVRMAIARAVLAACDQKIKECQG